MILKNRGDQARARAVSRSATIAIVAVLGLLVGAPQAFGHAAFLASDPAPGVRLEAAPSQVTLTFTEPLNRRLASAELVSVDGARVTTRSRATSARSLVLRPNAKLARGAYRIRWHSVSTQDGHALEGTFSFGVRTAAVSGGHAIEQSPLARRGWMRVGARILLYVALLLFAGGLLLRVMLGGDHGSWLTGSSMADVDARELTRVREREQAVIGDLGVFAVAAAVLAALLEAADAAGGLSAQGVSDYLLGNVAGAARLAVVFCALLALVLWQRRAQLAAVCAALALGAVAASGHAGSATPRMPSIINDWLHLLAGAVWLGGIALIVIVYGPSIRGGDGRGLRRRLARRVLPAFGRVALPAFALVISTGAVSLLVQLGELSDLWRTDYGRVLAVKIALVGVIALLSCWHARRLAPRSTGAAAPSDTVHRRQWRLLRAQPLLGLAAVAAVALLATFPLPPRQLQDADAVAPVRACDPCPLPRPAADELAVADDAGRYVVAAWLRRDRAQVSGTVRVLDRKGRPAVVPLRVGASRQTICAPGCRRFSATGDTVVVSLMDGGRRHTARLPARWKRLSERRARALLMRVQQKMRSLRSVRQSETVTSGPGTFARTQFRLRAPDRLAYVTDRGIENVVIGLQRWFRAPDVSWRREPFGSGIAFSTRSWFRWSSYAQEVRLLRTWRRAGGRFAQLALTDPGTPVWLRLTVGLDDLRVRREKLTAPARFMVTSYSAFDRPISISAPKAPR